MQKMCTKNKKKPPKIEDKCTPKIFIIKHIKNEKKNAPQKYQKMKKTHRNCKNHTKNAKNDISGTTDILPGVSLYWLSPITSFHHIGDNRYYRDILESVTSLTSACHPPWAASSACSVLVFFPPNQYIGDNRYIAGVFTILVIPDNQVSPYLG
jgi:hypothetical protein